MVFYRNKFKLWVLLHLQNYFNYKILFYITMTTLSGLALMPSMYSQRIKMDMKNLFSQERLLLTIQMIFMWNRLISKEIILLKSVEIIVWLKSFLIRFRFSEVFLLWWNDWAYVKLLYFLYKYTKIFHYKIYHHLFSNKNFYNI